MERSTAATVVPLPQKTTSKLHIIRTLVGRKCVLDVAPEFVCRGLLAYLSAYADWFWRKLGWNPGFNREKWFLKSAF